MPILVGYEDDRLEFVVPEERVVASWSGPAGLDRPHELAAIREAIEQPCDFPPLRQMIVPGDRVAIALDSTIARPQPILEAIGRVLREAGVEPEDLTVLAPSSVPADLIGRRIACRGPRWRLTTPGTAASLRISPRPSRAAESILNRILTDADVVIPVGRLGYDPIMGYRGPWSVVFPQLSERASD